MNSFKITGILAFLLVSFFTSTSTGFARYSYGDAMANLSQASSTSVDNSNSYNSIQTTYVDTSSSSDQSTVNTYNDSSYVYATSTSSSYQDISTYSNQDSSMRYSYGRRSPPDRRKKDPPPVPEYGVCSSIITGPQSYPLTFGACEVGYVNGFTAQGTSTIEYSWFCGGSNGRYPSQICRASYTPPVQPPPPPSPVNGVCSSSITGPQSYPLTSGACDVGYVVGFKAD